MGCDDFDDNTQKLANVLDNAVSDGNWTNTQLRRKADALMAGLTRAGFVLLFPDKPGVAAAALAPVVRHDTSKTIFKA